MTKFKGVMHKLGCPVTDDEAKEVRITRDWMQQILYHGVQSKHDADILMLFGGGFPQVIAFYDVDNSGLITYKELIKDIQKMDRDWMSYSEDRVDPITDFSSRVVRPPILSKVGTSAWLWDDVCVHHAYRYPRLFDADVHHQLQDKVRKAAEDWAAKFKKIQSATARDAFHGICLRFDRGSSGRVSMADFTKVSL